MLNRSNNSAARYAQIEEDLRKRILSGEFAGGTALPGELFLCASYGVSRKTVRKALENLRTQNFIRKHQGCGNFVIPATEREKLPRCMGKAAVMLPGDFAENPFAGELLAGIYKSASLNNVQISVLPQDTSCASLLEMYYNFEIDAFLWGALPESLPEAVTELAQRKIPQVVVNFKIPGTGAVLYDSYPAWRAVLNCFRAAGHKYAAFIDHSRQNAWISSRRQAFLEAADSCGMRGVIVPVENEQMLKDFILNERKCSAYITVKSYTAAFLEAAPPGVTRAEFTPDEISGDPDVIRIHVPAQKMGFEALRLLVDNHFAEDPGAEIQVPCFAVLGLSVTPYKNIGENLCK